jgi:glycosyltransferase involved in cell wall biosynthesis
LYFRGSMRIGINTRFLLSTKMEGFGWYTFEVVKRLVQNHPEHEFIFFFDRVYDERFIFAKNVTPVVLFPPARHPFLFLWWFEISVKKALNKHKIDVFFSPDGYLSLSASTKQIAVIHDLNFEHNPTDVPPLARWYLRTFFPRFAKKATAIITVSEFSKNDIIETYHIEPSKIQVAWNGASTEFVRITDEEKLLVRERYSKNRPYFLFVGSLHPRKNLPNLLRAFHEFAKTNKDVDLIIAGAEMWKNNQLDLTFLDEEASARIQFTGHVSLVSLTELMGAAHAFIYVPYFEGFGIPLVEAMRCGIPIIAGNKTALPEVAGDAALLVDPYNVEEIAANMHELATNELVHAALSEKSYSRSALFSWDNSAAQVWQIIENVYQQ